MMELGLFDLGVTGTRSRVSTPIIEDDSSFINAWTIGTNAQISIIWTHTGSGSVIFNAYRNIQGVQTLLGTSASTNITVDFRSLSIPLIPGYQTGDVTIKYILNGGAETTFATLTPPLPSLVEQLYGFDSSLTATDGTHATPCGIGDVVNSIRDVITGTWIDKSSGSPTLEQDGNGRYYLQCDGNTVFSVPSTAVGGSCVLLLSFLATNEPAVQAAVIATDQPQWFALYETSGNNWYLAASSGTDLRSAALYSHNRVTLAVDTGVKSQCYLDGVQGVDQSPLAFPATALKLGGIPGGLGGWTGRIYGVAILTEFRDSSQVAGHENWSLQINGQ